MERWTAWMGPEEWVFLDDDDEAMSSFQNHHQRLP